MVNDRVTIFKITEAIVMRDVSIIKGMLLCFKKQQKVDLGEIRKSIKIKNVNREKNV